MTSQRYADARKGRGMTDKAPLARLTVGELKRNYSVYLAAPDLLAALQAADIALRIWYDDNDIANDLGREGYVAYQAMLQVRAAIAKAEGQQ